MTSERARRAEQAAAERWLCGELEAPAAVESPPLRRVRNVLQDLSQYQAPCEEGDVDGQQRCASPRGAAGGR